VHTVVVRWLPGELSRLALCAAAVVLVVPACSGEETGAGDGTDPSTTPVPTIGRVTVAESTTPTTEASAAPTTSSPVVADTGVPGLDSADEFCRSWSEFAGTFQALALAASLARDPADAARTEVAGSSTIVAAAAGLDEHLPDELEPEREALTAGLVGPMARRAAAAVDALNAAGLTDAEISALGEAWLGTLTTSGLDEPIEDVPLDPAVADRVDAAAASLAAARPSIVEDPALITDASTPLTLAYLADHCPDQGILAGNDIVDQP